MAGFLTGLLNVEYTFVKLELDSGIQEKNRFLPCKKLRKKRVLRICTVYYVLQLMKLIQDFIEFQNPQVMFPLTLDHKLLQHHHLWMDQILKRTYLPPCAHDEHWYVKNLQCVLRVEIVIWKMQRFSIAMQD